MPLIPCPNCGWMSSSTDVACNMCGKPMPGARSHQVAAHSHQVDVHSACLRATDGNPVPLLGVALGGEVFGAHARVVLRQRYKNRETKPIEAVYTFPIPSDATLVGFAMECEGRRIEAEVKEREEAFAAYDDAVSKGHGAALLEQERPNIFTASVGNLLPDEETIVEVTFLQKLTADEGALRLMIPTLVAPKYMPGAPAGDRTGHGAASPTDAVPDADRISPKIGDVKYGLAMDILFDLGRDVTIESPSHAIRAAAEGDMRQRVTFESKTVALDRDIVLIAEGAPGVTAGVVCDKPAGEEGTFALTIVPDLFEAKKRSKGRAVVFVVDVSGSMQGESIEQARRALRLCLRHLTEGDLFDIVPFSSSYGHFSLYGAGQPRAGLIRFTQTTLQQADQYVDVLQANGGTEMLAPLCAAAQLLAGAQRDRVIVLLTDGQVGNEQQIVEEVSKQAAGARVYTVGIGTNVSDYLLRDLAKRTKGAVEFIHPGERIDDKVTAQFARATAARVDGVTLKWVGVDAGEVAPADPPALVDGGPWSVYGRYETPGMGRVEIRGTLGGEAFFTEVSLDLMSGASRPALTSLWAGARVRDLEAVDPASLGRRAEAHKKRIVDLCVRHKIASKYTSFIVVEKRTGDRRAQGQPETRAVPVNAPAGWAMFAKGAADTGRSQTKAGTVRHSMAVPGRAPAPSGSPFGNAGAAPPPPMMRSYSPQPAMRAPAPAAAYGPPPSPHGASQSPWSAAAPAPGGFVQGGYGAPPAPGGGFGPPPAPSFSASGGGAPPPAQGFGPPPVPASPMMASPPPMAAPARSAPMAQPAVAQAAPAVPATAKTDDIGAAFARQLASGLWESGDASDRGRLAATTACLTRCAAEGIDTSHPVYGAQLTKAIEALSALVEALAQKAEADAELIRALYAMAAVSAGKRARGRIAAIAQAAASAQVKAIAAELSSQDAAKKRLTA